jgi:hypothetical protein
MGDAKIDALLYYGSYRQDREVSFRSFFKENKVRQVIATPTRTFKKFAEIAPHLERAEPLFPLVEGISDYRASLYIEDETTHHIYHSLANRFYEAASAGQCLFVDARCQDTFVKAGVRLDQDWIVRDATDILVRWPRTQQIRDAQRNAWNQPFAKELDLMLERAIGKLNLWPRLWIPRPRRIHYKEQA